MKANEAPEKIYIPRLIYDGKLIHEWNDVPFKKFRFFFDKEIAENIEYIRKDAFIKKVEKAMIEWTGTYISKTTGGGVGERKALATDLLNYFKKYMKGEQGMTKEEIIQGLESIESRAIDFPYMTASDWVTIAAAKRKLNPNSVWNSENVVPKYNLNGVTDFIISSAYGHIEGVAYTYTPEQWSAHLGFNANRDFRWAYEKDLIDFD